MHPTTSHHTMTTTTTTRCRHPRSRITTVIRPYSAPVSTVRPNPAAHGNVCHWETCTCGATRQTNVNGQHTESTGWQRGEGVAS